MIRRVGVRRRPGGPPVSGLANPVIARVLGARGLERAPDYSLSKLLPPVLNGLDEAVEILSDAIRHGRRILVVGDFDADGATGTALAVRALTAMGAADVRWRVPDRFRHGYGLSPELAAECLELKPAVLITVDQGVSSLEGVEVARRAGIEVIVTDHHLPGPELPAASSIINPNLPGDPFPSNHLAGVGVMFYLLIALRAGLRDQARTTPVRLDAYLDLVAVGTVADMVVLDENNRRLVFQGLRRIAARRCAPGIAALMEVAGRNLGHVTAADLGFAVAPRLNAAGRLEDMGIGIRCLLEDHPVRAMELARRLDAINRDRRAVQAAMTETAEAQARILLERLDGADCGLCVYDENWHQGVVGLVASRLCERLQRPVIAFAPAEDGSLELKGSCRSPAGVHMRDLLVQIDHAHPGLIDRFGGHSRAAGLSLAASRLEAFRAAFQKIAGQLEFTADEVLSDGELAPHELCLDTAAALDAGGPWGQGWPEPLFDGRFRALDRRVLGHEHLKLRLQHVAGGAPLDAIAFRAGRLAHGELPDPLCVTYRLEVNRWMGKVRAQLVIQHLVEAVRK